MPASAYTANLIAAAIKNGTAYQGPATVYLGLAITQPTAADAGTEVTGSGYARVSYAVSGFTSDGIGGLSNNAQIAWATATDDYPDDVLAVVAWTALTSGTFLWYIDLSSPSLVIDGQTPKFSTGQLVLTVV